MKNNSLSQRIIFDINRRKSNMLKKIIEIKAVIYHKSNFHDRLLSNTSFDHQTTCPINVFE